MKKDFINQLENRLIHFGTEIIIYAEKEVTTTHLRNQIIRSGTAPALNYGEARSAESRKDFVHKMKVCLKELRETNNYLRIISIIKEKDSTLERLIRECGELMGLFISSIQTASGNKAQSR